MNWIKPKSYSFTRLSIHLHAPAKSGVYYLHNSARCIYVGEAENIRHALLAHLQGDIPWITVWDPTGFSFELCSETLRVHKRNELTTLFRPALRTCITEMDESPAQVHFLDVAKLKTLSSDYDKRIRP